MLGNGLFSTYNPPAVWANDSFLMFDGINDYCIAAFASTVDASAIMVRDNFTLNMWVEGQEDIEDDCTIWEMREVAASNVAYMRLWYDYSEEKLYFIRTDIDGANEQSALFSLSNSNFKKRNMITVTCVTTHSDVPGVSQIFVNSSGGTAKTGGAVGPWSGAQTKLYYGATAGTSQYFTGWIDNIAIWKGVLDSPTIVDIYNSREPKNETNSKDLMFYHAVNERDFIEGINLVQNISYNAAYIPRFVTLSGTVVYNYNG